MSLLIRFIEQKWVLRVVAFKNVRPVGVSCLAVLLLSLLSFPGVSAGSSGYGEIIKNTPEYERITTPNDENDGEKDSHDYSGYQIYHGPYYHPAYPVHYPYYYPPGNSGPVGFSGEFYIGLAIGTSKFEYDDNENGDASFIRFGYRPRENRLGYELSFFDSGNSEVTSLSEIELQVDTVNFALTLNSSRNNSSQLNLYGQGGIYFADTTLYGPFDSVSERSNGFLLAVGVEFMLSRHFSLRAEASNLFDVKDFANDESISSFNLGGNIIF